MLVKLAFFILTSQFYNTICMGRCVCQFNIIFDVSLYSLSGYEVQIETPDLYQYHYLEGYGVSVSGYSYITFLVRASNDAHVTLSTYKNSSHYYEIVIGKSPLTLLALKPS